MKNNILIGTFASLIVLTGAAGVQADTHAKASCDLKVGLSMKAEMQEGGAHFKGKLGTAMAGMKMDKKKPGMKMDMKKPGMKMDMKKSDMKMDMKKPGMKMDMKKSDMKETGMKMASAKMPGMKKDGKMNMSKGAHEVHIGAYGGTFFMAPNKTHHIEGQYSEKCGFNLVIYNAMTQPIDVNRFRAFVKFIPEDDDQIEAYLILAPSPDGSVLQAAKGPHIEGPFDIELYVSFPGRDEPDMFNIATAKKEHDE